MVFDARRERVVLFSGIATGDLKPPADTWEWDGTNWTQVSFAPDAAVPEGRFLGAASYDEQQQRMTIWGGLDVFAAGNNAYDDLWTFDGTSWTQAAPSAPFGGRFYATGMAFDRVTRQNLVFSGLAPDGTPFTDTWSWISEWSPILPRESPPGRGAHASFQAPDGPGVCIYGGTVNVSSPGTLSDTWLFRSANDEPREICAQAGLDNDRDGKSACDDPDCAPACAYCGDGLCSAQENCRICANDCGACTVVCGDNVCDGGETLASCPGDCSP